MRKPLSCREILCGELREDLNLSYSGVVLDRANIFPDSLAHGFSDRLGGVSRGRYASLNVSAKWGDEPAAVAENHRRIAGAGGFDLKTLCLVRQVHSAKVIRACEATEESEADAIWAHRDDPPAVVGVLTADCVPVLLADADATVWAAIHSGWKGTVAGIVPAAVRALVGVGIEPGELRAAIGPCISLDAFEVGPEVACQFPEEVVERSRFARPHVDLVAMVQRQLLAAGVRPENVERVGGCTHTDARRYFSYRRDGAGIGQHLAFIGGREGR
ncbi:MAG TPA: laccase domain-containing protein [Nannocystis exedens]|nr:laccase domain-containing protein [Nannocystis exedens]